ncbi:MAG: Ig-like domain-containing protein [Lachnospiraceae bacterium]
MASTTEELEAQILAEMEANPETYLVEPVNDILMIDPETRMINVPASETLFGTSGECDVERKYFKCPKIVGDNIDLSKHRIYISYMSVKEKNITSIPDTTPDMYYCEDMAVDGDYITFSWKLSGNVLKNPGFIGFAVVAKFADGDSLKTRWKTTPAVGTVLLTLPDGEAIEEKYPDIITQLLNRMDEVEAIATPEAMQGYVNNYMDENPPSGMTADEKAQLNKNTEDISSLSGEIGKQTGTGLSTEAIDKLEEVGNYLAYTTADGGSKWTELIAILRNGETVPATGITLNKTTLSFTDSATQTLVVTVEPSNSTDKVTWESDNEEIATVANGVVTPVSNGSCTITAKAGSYSASCEVTVAVESEIVTYTITNNLTNVSTDNPVTTITENSPYEANLTPDTGHEFDSVIVTMGGIDITDIAYADGVITIGSATGNIVVTASAKQSGSTEEITILKSITGDGNSYIDTEVLADVGHRYEFCMKLSEPTKYFFGADMYNVGTAYKNLYLYNAQKMSISCMLNGLNNTNIGTWNGTDANLLTNKQFYFVLKSGLQAVYLDAEYTTQQSNVTNGTVSFEDSETLPIIPLYLFKVNYNEQTNPGNMANYVPADTTVYWFKVYDDSTNELLHEFVPAMIVGKIGMYDTVTGKFHENKGIGTFSYEEVSE